MSELTAAAPPAGFADPVLESQRVFRAVLDAVARPGRVVGIELAPPPAPLQTATAAVALTLLDFATPVWLAPALASPAAVEYLTFHTGCPLAETRAAAGFAVLDGGREDEDFDGFARGTPEYPDRSATLIVQVGDLLEGAGIRLTGPGIRSEHRLTATGLAPAFWQAVLRNALLFPRGLDFVLTAGRNIACLPRTTRAEA